MQSQSLEQFADHLITGEKPIWGQSDDGRVSERVLRVQLRRWNFILIYSHLASFVKQTDARIRGLPIIATPEPRAGCLSGGLKMFERCPLDGSVNMSWCPARQPSHPVFLHRPLYSWKEMWIICPRVDLQTALSGQASFSCCIFHLSLLTALWHILCSFYRWIAQTSDLFCVTFLFLWARIPCPFQVLWLYPGAALLGGRHLERDTGIDLQFLSRCWSRKWLWIYCMSSSCIVHVI